MESDTEDPITQENRKIGPTVTKQQQIKSVWMLSREYGNLAGAGGVKDVACQLAESLARWSGRSVHVVVPCYGFIDAPALGFQPLTDPLCPDKLFRLQIAMHQPDAYVQEEVGYYVQKINRVHLYLVDAARFRQKSAVYTYTEDDEIMVSWQKKSMGHHDYFAMNLLHQKAALELMICLDAKPDIIHCHDGHTAVLPALIRENPGYRSYFRGTGCLVTIHNAGFGYHQEVADIPYARSITDLPDQVIVSNMLAENFDPFLVAGGYAVVNTVSENYARELQETANDEMTGWLGHELKRRNIILEGVTNGIDPDAFSSSAIAGDDQEMLFDPGNGDDDKLLGKLRCKAVLLNEIADGGAIPEVQRFGTLQNREEYPLFTFIGRLSEQKGIDILLEVMDVFLERNDHCQLLVLGIGNSSFESQLIAQAENTRLYGRMCFLQGFSPHLANRIFAAGDFFIVPSRYEPCGLTDFIAQLFGNIPVVHHVGGLVKVRDAITGIAYRGDSQNDLLKALERALVLYLDLPAKRTMQLQAIREIERNYTWTKVMQKYLELYREARRRQVYQ